MASDPNLESLQDALSRAVSTPPWWRRLLPGGRRGAFPAMAALGAVLVLSLVGIAAPWDDGPSPARGGGAFDDGPVLRSPSPEAADPDQPPGRSESGNGQPAGAPEAGGDCPPPLSVVAAVEIAPLVDELAGPLAGGSCPQVAVRAQEEATTRSGDAAPDVWIPGSSLWLRQAASGSGADLPTSGDSIARSPVVLAAPEPVADTFASEDWWEVWIVWYEKVTGGEVPTMSMADPDTTVGALALVAFVAAVDHHWSDADGGGFLQMIHFRDHLAATDARPAALFDELATTPPAPAVTEVGVFPATEQQVLAYGERETATAAVAMGTYEAMSEADYPMAVAGSLDDRRAGIAAQLDAALRAPEAVDRLVDAGFRPPRGASADPAALDDTARFPDDYPDPVAVPDTDRWQDILDGWTWTA